METKEETKELIIEATSSLEKFNQYLQNRHNYKPLKNWLLFKKIVLDDENQLGRIDHDSIDPFIPVIGNIVSLDDLWKINRCISYSFGFGSSYDLIPKVTDRCALCDRGWTINNVTDIRRNNSKLYHEKCLKINSCIEESKHISKYFTDAGFTKFVLKPIENKYDHSRPDPWFEVMTIFGTIVIGWRKNVVSIDWLDTGATIIVTEDNVTKNERMVHAWTEEKIVEYLSTLFKYLSTQTG